MIDNPDAPGSAWQTNPAWNMALARGRLNAVILPNRRVLVLGGGGWNPTPPPGQAIPRLTPELLDPVALTWEQAGDQRHPRIYHAVAGLLASGQVYSAGGEDQPGFPSSEHTLEVFSPKYMFVGGAPAITSAPAAIGYTGTFNVGVTTFGSPVERVVLIRQSSVTHHFDFDQRYVELSFTTNGSTLSVDVPPTAGVAPPGYYLLFVVSAAGVPSEGRWVHVN